jgi:hypothetical protein
MGFATAVFSQSGWKKDRIQLPLTVCYASNESHVSYIGPPKEYFDRLKSASLRSATIEVTYVGFSAEAQQAFQFAVDLWKNMIFSPVPIRIKANWVSLNSGVLGSCGPSGYYKNFDATEKWNCYYPVALVEKMLGEEVNTTGQYELEANFNKDFANWYLGTDGNTPSRQYDFVSVVLHELTHGLGFTGLFYSSNGQGSYNYGDDPLASIFDQYVINRAGEKLVNKSIFPDPSVKLNLALTSGWLEFNTRLADNKLPRLFAPATWNSGSSIYHLDDASYPAGDPNSLMTPFTGMGEAIHSPGPGTLAIMYEMGWKSISIRHQPLKDLEFVSVPLVFNATIESDYPLDSSKLYLVYSLNRFTKKDSLLLKPTNTPGLFTASISQYKNAELDYFFTATDINQRRFVFPSNAPARYLHFKIGVDNELPVVVHEPIKYMLSSNTSTTIEATVTDNLGIKSVYIEYFVNGGTIKQIPMSKTVNDVYSGNFVFPAGTVKGGDKISYRIVAVDASSQSNVGRSPVSGYHIFTIEKIQIPAETYANNFNTTTNDFIGTDFNVSRPSGFDTPALNSAHPYPSPDADNIDYNFTTILRNPIILKDGGKMSYDEIVLVEPGDAGTKFGDENFFDYVIVEGSKDGGITWKPLIDGYDSNLQPSWYQLFTSTITSNNSTGVPTKDLYVKHEFDLLANGNFNAGETILIRFRLFSDPYSHGWGWIIDNLSIQDIGTDANSIAVSSGEVSFYPNPASSRLNIQVQTKNILGKIVVKAYNSSGAMVYNQQMTIGSNTYKADIDVSSFIPGLYLFAVETEKGNVIGRKIVIQ